MAQLGNFSAKDKGREETMMSQNWGRIPATHVKRTVNGKRRNGICARNVPPSRDWKTCSAA